MKQNPEDHSWAEARKAHANVLKMQAVRDEAAEKAADDDALERTARDEVAKLESQRAQLIADEQAIPEDTVIARAAAVDDAIRAANVRLAIRINRATQSRAIHASALNGLRASETVRGKVIDAMLYGHVERLTTKLDYHMTEALTTGEEVRKLIGTGLNVPINVAERIFTDRVRAVLARLPEKDGIHTPVSELRGGGLSAVDHWTARRAAILKELESDVEAES